MIQIAEPMDVKVVSDSAASVQAAGAEEVEAAFGRLAIMCECAEAAEGQTCQVVAASPGAKRGAKLDSEPFEASRDLAEIDVPSSFAADGVSRDHGRLKNLTACICR